MAGWTTGPSPGGCWPAELAALPLLDLLAAQLPANDVRPGHPRIDVGRAGDLDQDGWTQLASLDRVEVYQATGMIMAALDVDQAEALVRLRAHAYAVSQTAAQVAAQIVERRMSLHSPDWRESPPLGRSGR